MNRPTLRTAVVVLSSVASLATAVAAQEPEEHRAARPGVQIQSIEIQVEDLATGQQLAPFGRGGQLQLLVGQRVRLRMAAIPSGNGAARYPSARFTPNAQSRVIVEAVNEKVGSITLEARRVDQPNEATVVFYEVLGDFPMDQQTREGRIYVQVVAPEPEPAPEPAPRPRPAPVEAPSGPQLGITFFEHGEFRGRSQKFFDGMTDMRRSQVGNDAVSSLRVDPGCRAVLYEHQNSRGRSTVVTADVSYLGGSQVGNDSMSSFELECVPPESRRGASLFDAEDFRGIEEVFYGDDGDLRDNRVGDDRARSVRIDRGCRVTLYESPEFRGRSTVVDRDFETLRGSQVGLDSVSSLRIACR